MNTLLNTSKNHKPFNLKERNFLRRFDRVFKSLKNSSQPNFRACRVIKLICDADDIHQAIKP